jgi:hypothetical protein
VVVDQRRRIEALEARGARGDAPRGLSEDDPVAQQILETVDRLVDQRPERLRELSRLVAALEEFLGGRDS